MHIFLHAPQLMVHTNFVCCIYGRILLHAANVYGKCGFQSGSCVLRGLFCFSSALCVGCVNGTNDVASVWAPCCAGVVACPMLEVLWRVLCLFALMR